MPINLAPVALLSAIAVFYVLCFQWERIERLWSWGRAKWPLMTVKQHEHDVEATIIICETLAMIDPDRFTFEWPLDPRLWSARLERIRQAERDEQWAELMAATAS